MENTSPEKFAKETAERTSQEIERASAGAHRIVDRTADAALGATERLGTASAQFAETASRWTDATRDRVRRNPFASLGIAIGVAVGMVLGAGLFFQRRNRWPDRESGAH